MARLILGLSQRDLANRAEIQINTIHRIEGDGEVPPGTLLALKEYFEGVGVVFIDQDRGGPGVRLEKAGTLTTTSKLMIYAIGELKRVIELGYSFGDYPVSASETMRNEFEWEYYAQGQSAVHIIENTLSLVLKKKTDIKSILDFACGHGRVMRALRVAFPDATLYASDLDEKGVKFCADTFDAIPVISDEDLSQLTLPEKIDLIWIGSLFTHIEKSNWKDFLLFFSRHLNTGGVLIFTYAGQYVASLVNDGDHDFISDREAETAVLDYMCTGFGFMQYIHRSDRYGRTICKPSWVSKFMESNFPEFRPVLHYERGWGARQDVYVAVKDDLFIEARTNSRWSAWITIRRILKRGTRVAQRFIILLTRIINYKNLPTRIIRRLVRVAGLGAQQQR